MNLLELPLAVRLTKARTALLLEHPFFGTLLFRLKPIETVSVATMATDGVSLFYNPEFAKGLPPGQLVGVLAHEVMHPALHHDTRRGDRDHKLWNQACDYAINPLLLDAGLQLPADGLFDQRFVGMSAEQIYNLLDQEREEPKPPNETGDAGNEAQSSQSSPPKSPDMLTAPETPGGFGQVLDAPIMKAVEGAEQKALISHEHEREWQIAVERAESVARLAGKTPAGLERSLDNGEKARANWREALRRTFSETLPADYSWLRPNRRFLAMGLYLPGIVREGIGEIAIAVDCSGSISKRVLGLFEAEIAALTQEHQPERVHVVYFDTEIHRHDVFERGKTITLQPAGGGGTSFEPIFSHLEHEGVQPHSVIVLTDLLGSFPRQEPFYPVIWASTRPGRVPFGAVISLEAA